MGAYKVVGLGPGSGGLEVMRLQQFVLRAAIGAWSGVPLREHKWERTPLVGLELRRYLHR